MIKNILVKVAKNIILFSEKIIRKN